MVAEIDYRILIKEESIQTLIASYFFIMYSIAVILAFQTRFKYLCEIYIMKPKLIIISIFQFVCHVLAINSSCIQYYMLTMLLFCILMISHTVY